MQKTLFILIALLASDHITAQPSGNQSGSGMGSYDPATHSGGSYGPSGSGTAAGSYDPNTGSYNPSSGSYNPYSGSYNPNRETDNSHTPPTSPSSSGTPKPLYPHR